MYKRTVIIFNLHYLKLPIFIFEIIVRFFSTKRRSIDHCLTKLLHTVIFEKYLFKFIPLEKNATV